jgi:DNA invertase Pin-like site-specific DNA recombinase
MKGQPKVGIYARICCYGQDATMQIAELKLHCKARGWLVSGEYVDKGISGAKNSRPELNRLMADAHRRRIDIVAVWKFDRFARSVSHLLKALESFRSLGIEFVSLSEQVDTSTPTGKMVFTVLGAVAELERSLIGERVRAGLRNAKANGKTLGRPAKRTLSAAEIVCLRRDRRQQMSFKGLAQKYGVSVWSAFHLCQKAKG